MDTVLKANSFKRWQITPILLLVFTIQSSTSIEEPAPEVFLSPRHFNPHPYEANNKIETTSIGPIVFPSAGDELVNRNNFVTLSKINSVQHPVDHHPYAKLAKKNRFRLVGKYHTQENQANPKAYQALAKHGSKVLTRPVQDLKEDYVSAIPLLNDKNDNYAFSYKVVDRLTGDDFSHQQMHDSKTTNGEYRVKLPDGRLQIVSYRADKNGYNADVKYTNTHSVNLDRNHAQEVQIQRVPVRQLSPIFKHQSYDYYDDLNLHHVKPNKQFYFTSADTENYNNYIHATPEPFYQSHNIQEQTHLIPKVQIITTNPRDHIIGNYIPNGPYISKNINHYQAKTVSSTAAPFILNQDKHGIVVHSTPAPFYDIIPATITPVVINNGNHGHISQSTFNNNFDHILVTTAAPVTVAPKTILVNGAEYHLVKGQHGLHLKK